MPVVFVVANTSGFKGKYRRRMDKSRLRPYRVYVADSTTNRLAIFSPHERAKPKCLSATPYNIREHGGVSSACTISVRRLRNGTLRPAYRVTLYKSYGTGIVSLRNHFAKSIQPPTRPSSSRRVVIAASSFVAFCIRDARGYRSTTVYNDNNSRLISTHTHTRLDDYPFRSQ